MKLQALWEGCVSMWRRIRASTGSVAAGAEAPEDEAIAASRRLIWGMGVTVAVLVAWAALYDLDIASQGAGEATPAGQLKRIQHLEGGIVQRIHVREGQFVRSGEPLVELEGTASETETAEIRTRVAALRIRIARLEAQLRGSRDVRFDADLIADHPEAVREARELFDTQRERFRTSSTGQDLKVHQRRAETEEMNSRIDQLENRRTLLDEQVAISARLLSEGLTNQYTHLDLLKEQSNVAGELEESRAALRRLDAAYRQEQVALRAIDVDEDETVRSDLADSRNQLAEFQERLKRFADSSRRSVIRAPLDGTVMTLHVVTEGGVVAPGGTVMTLVPGHDRLVVQARLPVSEVGFVQVGQRARLQLLAAAGRRVQPMSGRVTHVSPDAVVEPEREPYILVRIEPDSDSFEGGSFRYRLSPGAPLQAAIVTGRRSVLGYLLDPFRSSVSGALIEP